MRAEISSSVESSTKTLKENVSLKEKLSKLESLNKDLSNKLKDKEELVKALEIELTEIDEKTQEKIEDALAVSQETLRTKLQEKDKALVQLKKEILIKDEELKSLTNDFEIVQIEYEKLKIENDRLIKEVDVINEELKLIKEENSEMAFKLDRKESKVNKYDHILEENDSLKKKIREFETTQINTKKMFDFEPENSYSNIMTAKGSSQFFTGNNYQEEIINFLSNNRDFVSLKRQDKGSFVMFIPHSPGVYGLLTLGAQTDDHEGKYFKIDCILNIEVIEEELREMLLFIFKQGKQSDCNRSSQEHRICQI